MIHILSVYIQNINGINILSRDDQWRQLRSLRVIQDPSITHPKDNLFTVFSIL